MSEQNVQLYAQALHQALIAEWQRMLRDLATQVGSLSGSAQDQAAAVEKALPANAPAALRNFALTLVKNNDLRALPEVAAALGAFIGETTQAVSAEVQSAAPLTDAQRQQVESQLAAKYGRGLDVRYSVDPALLGGLIVRVGDQVIDTSVRSRLAAVHRAMVTG